MPERVGGIALRADGRLAVALAQRVYALDFGTGERSLQTPSLMTQAALHECACDRQARLWLGAIDHRVSSENMTPGGCALFRQDAGALTRMRSGISCSNGLAFSPDGRKLYHADAPTGTIMAWTLDLATGDISDPCPFCRIPFDEGFIDGATVDEEGGYWVALPFAGRMRRYLPDGTLDRDYILPFSGPTKMTFGGAERDILFITTTKISLDAPSSLIDGGVYAFQPGFRGVVEPLLYE